MVTVDNGFYRCVRDAGRGLRVMSPDHAGLR